MSNIADPNLVYVVPRSVLAHSLMFLRYQGARGHEGVVLWPGKLVNRGCEVKQCYVPRQITGPDFYRIPDDETFHAIEYVARRDWVVPVQLHSHPEEAFHSPVDDERAFVQHTNGISIVVPNFAYFADQLFLELAAVYSLVGGEEWRQLGTEEVQRRFCIVEA